MATRCSSYAAATVLACAILSPSQARAGAVLVTWGDTISHLGDVTPEHRQVAGAAKVGYKSSYWGVFWIDLWTWGGTYCIYEERRYRPINRAEAARLTGKPESALGAPFLYHVPLGWLILGPLFALAMVRVVIDRRKPPADSLAALFQDARYQKAMETVGEQYAKQGTTAVIAAPGQDPAQQEADAGTGDRFRAAFEAGIQHLVSEGVPREEAERNLGMMVNALAHAPRQ
jgi:hypothetical protein